MSSDLTNFFGAAAQTIPLLLLTLVVETTFLAGALRSKRVERAAESGDWASSLVYVVLKPLTGGIGGVVVETVVRELSRPLARALARPLGVAANGVFVFGSLLTAVVAEAAAFVGLAFDVKGIARQAIVIVVLLGLGLLLIETLAALVLVVITGRHLTPDQAGRTPPPGTSSGSGVTSAD